MSGTGTPEIDQSELAALAQAAKEQDLSVAVVASRWHEVVMDGLIAGSKRFFDQVSVTDVTVIRAPGSFELPVIASHAAQRFDVVVALGVVIRGGTPHFDYVCSAATEGLSQVALGTGTPVGFGLLTCDDEAQAIDRAGLEGSKEDKGFEASHAALAAAVEIAALQS